MGERDDFPFPGRDGPLDIEDLARILSHDLRTPLSIILLQAEIINRAPTSERNSQRAQTILTAGRQLSSMVQDVVDVLRLEAGAARLDPEPLDLETFLHDVPRGLAAGLDHRRVEVRLDGPLPRVHADSLRLERALGHLIANALQHSPESAPVRLASRRAGAWVRIAVSDSGEGIAAEHLPRLLDPSYRTATVRSGHGLGLGLYLCGLTARAHGGSLEVSSEPGKGSTFALVLPVKD